jgi:predicted oxidoreductase (fatty acid repression mutant protein)
LDSIISKEEAPTKSPATSREEVVDAILFYYESYVIDDIRFQFRWKETIEDTAENTTDIEEDIPAATIDTEILQIFQYYNIP